MKKQKITLIQKTTKRLSVIVLLFATAGTVGGQNQTVKEQPKLEQSSVLGQETQNNGQTPAEVAELEKKPCWITVLVHGTILEPFISKKWYVTPQGLHLAETLPSNNVKKIIESICAQDPEHFQLAHFYTFGWSGKLSLHARTQAAHQLKKSLEKIAKDYPAQGCAPRIRLITHSHGGNVALNMGQETMAEQKKGASAFASPLSIDELVLLACPVQHATEQYLASPMFKKIYSFYSDMDLVQIGDPQGLYHPKQKSVDKMCFFSKRQFLHQDNLIQIHVKLKGIYPQPIELVMSHLEFLMEHIFKKLPEFMKLAETAKEEKKVLVVNG